MNRQCTRRTTIHYPVPSREEHFDFLIRCYFGEGDDLLRLCIHRAYLDFNRTLHGFANHKRANHLRQRGYDCMFTLLNAFKGKKIRSQLKFDKWHEAACIQLQQQYRSGGFKHFSVGQAQKWLNMSMKYVFAIGERRLPGFVHLYQFAHIPIDNVFLNAAAGLGGPRLPVAWSRLDDYDTYLNCQQTFRDLFRGSIPLAAEFRLWLKAPSNRKKPFSSQR
jgi:hypothetical protein